MRRFEEPRSETFHYGFLTSRAARLLYEYQPGEPELDEESKTLLLKAERFIDQILNGEAFVSGDKENLTPSLEGLHVLQYGREALSVMQQIGALVAESRDRADLRRLLFIIKETVTAVREPSEDGLVAPERIEMAAKFFDVIADSLLDEALEYSQPKSVPAY